MELVPILSTIILIGTIMTAILAVVAYVLYKVREQRGRSAPTHAEAQQQAAPAEPHMLVTAGAQQALPSAQQHAPAMRLAPTRTLPRQGPTVTLDPEAAHLAEPPEGGWTAPPLGRVAAAAPPRPAALPRHRPPAMGDGQQAVGWDLGQEPEPARQKPRWQDARRQQQDDGWQTSYDGDTPFRWHDPTPHTSGDGARSDDPAWT